MRRAAGRRHKQNEAPEIRSLYRPTESRIDGSFPPEKDWEHSIGGYLNSGRATLNELADKSLNAPRSIQSSYSCFRDIAAPVEHNPCGQPHSRAEPVVSG
jgi:hypothetical protein